MGHHWYFFGRSTITLSNKWDIIGLLQHSNANNIPTKYLNTDNIPISKSKTFQTWDVIGISWHI